MGLPLLTEQIANNIWTTMTRAICDGDVPIMQALASFPIGVDNYNLVEKPVLLGYGVGPLKRSKVEAQEQRSTVGHTDGERGW